MHCGLCGNQIDKEHPFSDPASHKAGCPIYTDTEGVAKVIVEETLGPVICFKCKKPKGIYVTGWTKMPNGGHCCPQCFQEL